MFPVSQETSYLLQPRYADNLCKTDIVLWSQLYRPNEALLYIQIKTSISRISLTK